MEFLVKPPVEAELPSIAALYEEAAAFQKQNGIVQWQPGIYPTIEVARDALTKGILYGFYVDGTLAGTYILNPIQGDLYDSVNWGYPGTPMTVHAMAVSSAYRGKGIASRAMAAAEEIAIKEGKEVMRIDTNSANRFAQALFLRSGYRFVCPVIFSHREPPHQTYYCYEKKLERSE
ncbi:MAG: GNAT family N-acetyltransferase [Clostridiales bacterium]|nr:GNAT family N-acetyltransferase [Clostridiales bacterium]